MNESAAITGLGPVSALGNGVNDFWRALLNGRSAFSRLTGMSMPTRSCGVAAKVETPVSTPLDWANPRPRGVELALCAAHLAWDDAHFDNVDRSRVGVIVGTGVGNQDLIELSLARLRKGERLSPLTAFRSFAHAAACEIVRELDLQGPVQTVSSGCNSGADALGLALDWIRLGRADAVLVGGVEAELSEGFLGAMSAARALATRFNDWPEQASRPFDRGRDGNVPGEGAGFLVLERNSFATERGAAVRAGLRGFANRAAGARRSYDPFDPTFDPTPMTRTMRAALEDAGCGAGDVSAISANGSSSVFYDPLEAEAIQGLLGKGVDSTPVYSIKGALGQTGAVTPALQAIAAVLSIQHEMIPPTCNADDLDPRCPLRVVRGEPLSRPLDTVLINAIGFGGFYFASLVVGLSRTL